MLNPHYNDVYATGGLPEKHFVFVEHNRLPARFTAMSSGQNFTVAELGFGLGLAFLAAVQTWQTHAPAGARLTFASFEKHPVTAAQLAATHAGLPSAFQPLSQILRQDWPAIAAQPGWHSLTFGPSITLHLFHGVAATGLAHLANPLLATPANAWFLDGHDPRKNPDLWTPTLLHNVYQQTASGGTASTYSAAGHVRRALQNTGFTVTRQPGFPPKRHLLTAAKSAP